MEFVIGNIEQTSVSKTDLAGPSTNRETQEAKAHTDALLAINETISPV
jgi:hypothetical protein